MTESKSRKRSKSSSSRKEKSNKKRDRNSKSTSKRSSSSTISSSPKKSLSPAKRLKHTSGSSDVTNGKKVTSKTTNGRSLSSATKTSTSLGSDGLKVRHLPLPLTSSSSTTTTTTATTSTKSQLNINVKPISNDTNPVVVSFPSGIPESILKEEDKITKATASSSTNNNTDIRKNVNYESLPKFTYSHARTSSSRGRLIHGMDETCTYTGGNEGKGLDGRKTKLYIACYQKSTKSVTILPAAERGTVFTLSQKVTTYENNDGSSTGGAANLDFSNLSALEKRRLLFESFGSSKKQRALRSQAANVVEMQSVVGAGVGMMEALGEQKEGAVSQSNIDAMEEIRKSGGDAKAKATDKAQNEARRSYLPPFDKDADAPHKVYNAQEFAGNETWSQISRQVDACLAKDNTDDGEDWAEALQSKSRWFESTKSLLSSIKSPKKSGVKHQIKTIVLVNYLLTFHTKCSKTFLDGTQEDMARFIRLPDVVCNKFLSVFSAPSHDRGRTGYAITKQMKDKRVLHVLIMYLLANGRDMKVGSIEEVCNDLKIEVGEASKLYRMAGCTIKRGGKSGATSVSLSVPLEFPKVGKGK